MLPPGEGIWWVKVKRQRPEHIRSTEKEWREYANYEWHLIYYDPELYEPDRAEEFDPFFVELTTDHMFDESEIVEIGPEVVCPEPELAPKPHGN